MFPIPEEARLRAEVEEAARIERERIEKEKTDQLEAKVSTHMHHARLSLQTLWAECLNGLEWTILLPRSKQCSECVRALLIHPVCLLRFLHPCKFMRGQNDQMQPMRMKSHIDSNIAWKWLIRLRAWWMVVDANTQKQPFCRSAEPSGPE